ncbi:hypothetical protein ACGGZK_10645 [Agromyces sp. MMS24-K17]|uniref:hypothetical protein n=1 Tax=Agromyces sp. MMS24-K17 TaxID=3372850 RepID=UPI0037540B58
MDLAHAFLAHRLTAHAHDRLIAPSEAELAAAEARALARRRAALDRAEQRTYTERGRHRAAAPRPVHA